MGFTHMETADRWAAEHKRLLIKTTCSSPVKLWCLGVNVIAKAPQSSSLSFTDSHTRAHTRTHNLNGLTPTLQVVSITTLLKPAAAAEAACAALKPTIGSRNSWFSHLPFFWRCFFFFTLHRLQTSNLPSESSPIRHSHHSGPLRLQAFKWVTAGLKVLFLN